ncbi:MAG: Crp/Fnr family transcriptional regulator [Bacteroidales bacterium]|nr:Crp/Fnr family transcriptional regulator [Bacteroidales bacterium]
MLRTNVHLLSYVEQLYKELTSKDIILKEYPKGSFIFNQSEKSSKVIIIKEGFVKCFFSEENGKDFIVEFLGEGEIAGEIEAIRNIQCLCHIEALSDIQVYQFSTNTFRLLMKQNPQFNQLLINELAERIINTSSRASLQQVYSIKNGLHKLITLQERQHLRISKADMAAYLGVDIRSLNRVLKTIKETDSELLE